MDIILGFVQTIRASYDTSWASQEGKDIIKFQVPTSQLQVYVK